MRCTCASHDAPSQTECISLSLILSNGLCDDESKLSMPAGFGVAIGHHRSGPYALASTLSSRLAFAGWNSHATAPQQISQRKIETAIELGFVDVCPSHNGFLGWWFVDAAR